MIKEGQEHAGSETRKRDTPWSGEWGDAVTPPPNRRSGDLIPGSLYDRNRWDPINLPLRGSRGSLLSLPVHTYIRTIPLVRRDDQATPREEVPRYHGIIRHNIIDLSRFRGESPHKGSIHIRFLISCLIPSPLPTPSLALALPGSLRFPAARRRTRKGETSLSRFPLIDLSPHRRRRCRQPCNEKVSSGEYRGRREDSHVWAHVCIYLLCLPAVLDIKLDEKLSFSSYIRSKVSFERKEDSWRCIYSLSLSLFHFLHLLTFDQYTFYFLYNANPMQARFFCISHARSLDW